MRTKLLLCFTAIHLLAGRGTFFAQPAYVAYVQYGTEKGLSHDEVLSLALDRQGFLWIGTIDGLNRFDGRTFKNYRRQEGDPGSFPAERVYGITVAPDGRLWISTDRGLFRMTPVEGIFHPVRLPYKSAAAAEDQRVMPLVLDQQQFGWISTSESIIRLDLNDLSLQTYKLPDNHNGPCDIYIDRSGRIWVDTQFNLYQLDPADGSYRLYGGRAATDPALKYDMGQVREDAHGMVWVSSWGNGLYYYDEQADCLIDYPDGRLITTAFEFDRDESGNEFLWAGGSREGLYLWSMKEKKLYSQRPDPRDLFSHNGGMIHAILRDTANNIVWLGTDHGLEKYDPQNIRFHRVWLPHNQAYTIFSDVSDIIVDQNYPPEEQVYIVAVWGQATYRWKRRDNTFENIPWNRDTTNREVFDVQQDGRGNLWLGALNGLFFYDPKTGERRQYASFLNIPDINHKVITFGLENNGNILVGCNRQGLIRVDSLTGKGAVIPLVKPDGAAIENNFISELEQDRRGGWWIASNLGIFYLEAGCSEAFAVADPILPSVLSAPSLAIAPDETVWAVTTAGLLHFNKNRELLARYGPAEGLNSTQLNQVMVDVNGHVWVGTENGLYWHNPQQQGFYRMDKSDGLFYNSIDGAFTTTPAGDIFIGFPESFNFFNTRNPRINRRVPAVVLTDLRIMNQSRRLDPGEELVLRPKENMVSFDFAALNYSQSEKNEFAYRLKGFDQEWILSKEGQATYTNLDGGKYRLEIRASNNDGYWNEQGISIPIRVIPPFYKTAYFYLLLLLAGVAGLLLILRFRSRQYFREQAIRDRIARDLHDDMGSSLSSIRFFSEFAASKAKNPEVVPLLQQISETASKLSESMQDIIWAINSEKDHVEDLITRMREFGHRTLESRGIAFQLSCDELFYKARLGIQQRKNLYLIFKEAINNAAKYADCREVRLEISIDRGTLRMDIADDGRGYDHKTIVNGNGLANMRKRVSEIGGDIAMQSKPGEGTQVQVQMRVGKPRIS